MCHIKGIYTGTEWVKLMSRIAVDERRQISGWLRVGHR